MLMTPILEKFAKSNNEVFVGKIDARHAQLHQQFEIAGLPQLLFFRCGEEAARNVGPLGIDELQEFINQ